MKKRLFLAAILVALIGFSLVFFQPTALAQTQSSDLQQQTSPYYLPPKPVKEADKTFKNAWCGNSTDGYYICGTDPSQTTPHDVVYPTTYSEYEFQLSEKTFLALEYHHVEPDSTYSHCKFELWYWDEKANDWVELTIPWKTGTIEEPDGINWGTFDPDWTSKIEYHPNKPVYSAGSYNLVVSQPVRGDNIGYFPVQCSFTLYGWEIVYPNSTSITPTLTPTKGPCEIVVSPSSATIKAGETIDFAGAAITSQGVPMSNAPVTIKWGELEGTGYASGSSKTDPVGNFSFSYAVSANTNYNKTVTIEVSVGDCPVVKRIPITITGSSSNGNFITNIINQISSFLTQIWNMILGLFS